MPICGAAHAPTMARIDYAHGAPQLDKRRANPEKRSSTKRGHRRLRRWDPQLSPHEKNSGLLERWNVSAAHSASILNFTLSFLRVVAAHRLDFGARNFRFDCDLSELAIDVRVRRLVGEKILRPHLAFDLGVDVG